MMELRSFLFKAVYTAPVVLAETEKAGRLIEAMFDYYVDHLDEIPSEYRDISEGDPLTAVCDYIAGMTDRYARSRFKSLFVPSSIHY